RHVLVTGASSGIGEALAMELGARGAKVTVAARRVEKLEGVVNTIREKGGEANAIRADLSLPGSGLELARRVRDDFGHVDILVNNAGVSGGVSQFTEKNPAEIRECIEVNFAQPMALTHQLIPGMVERGYGCLVSVATASVFFPTNLASVYIATKRALVSIDEVLRIELAGSGVHVLTVFPGPVDTPMLTKLMATDQRAAKVLGPFKGTTDKLAKLTAKAIERERESIVYPAQFGVGRWVSPIMGTIMARLSAPLGLNR
ncbi:MAG: SDR family NAD(P)-dependent oxidoreductase, partial [Polyangiaceae bacterium]|nr:SDR family NAD(P)-dependent oxidoreductase [Polyangiaceae bacterium]